MGGTTLVTGQYPLMKLLPQVYPEYDWLLWRFSGKCPRNFWEDVKNQRKFMEWAGKELNIKENSDWYKINYKVNKEGKIGVIGKGYRGFGREIFVASIQLFSFQNLVCHFPRTRMVAMEIRQSLYERLRQQL